jgi:hypothetical protein
MKTVASTAGSVRTKLMMNQLPDAAKDLQTLATTVRRRGEVLRREEQERCGEAGTDGTHAATAAAGAATAVTR